MTAGDFARALRSLETLDLAAGDPQRSLRIAGLRVRLRFATPALATATMRALAHHAESGVADGSPDLTVFVLDRDSPGNPLRESSAEATSEAAEHGDRVERWIYDGDEGRGLRQEGFRALYLWHRALGRAAVCFDDARDLPYYQLALPLLPVLAWWLSERGLAIVHAAAVETGAGVVLIGGRSGAGKSTAALACLNDGMGYLGDDLCVVETGTPPVVHSLYCSAKLDPGDTARFPALAPALVPAARSGARESKAVYLFDRSFADRVVRAAPLLGVVIPDRGEPVAATPIAASRAFLAIAPNTVFLLPGMARAAAAGVKAVVTRVPVHALAVGTTIGEIPGRVRAHGRWLAAHPEPGAS